MVPAEVDWDTIIKFGREYKRKNQYHIAGVDGGRDEKRCNSNSDSKMDIYKRRSAVIILDEISLTHVSNSCRTTSIPYVVKETWITLPCQ